MAARNKKKQPALRTIQVLDPRELAPDRRHTLAQRVMDLAGKRVGFNVGVWPNYHVFVAHLEQLLKTRYPRVSTVRMDSQYNARKGRTLQELEDFAKNSDVVISGLGA